MKWFIGSVIVVVVLGIGGIFLLQSRWSKELLAHVLQEVALQANVKLSIGQIEGRLPLKWTFSDVSVTLPSEESVTIDQLKLRVSLLSLLRGRVGLSYLIAENVHLSFLPSTGGSSAPLILPPAFGIDLFAAHAFTVTNQANGETATYRVAGSGRWAKRGKVFAADLTATSPDLFLAVAVDCKKRQQGNLTLNVRSQKAFAPFYTLPIDLPFNLHLVAESRGSAIEGQLEVEAAPGTMVAAVVLGPDFFPTALHGKIRIPKISALAPDLQGEMSGDITLKGTTCSLLFETPALTANQVTFKEGRLAIDAHQENGTWRGPLNVRADHPQLAFHASGELLWKPHDMFQLQQLDLHSQPVRLAADITYTDALLGGVSLQIADLAPFSELLDIDLAGQIGGSIQLHGKEASCLALGKNLKIGSFISDRLDLHFTTFNFINIGTLKADLGPSYLDKMYLSAFSCGLGWNKNGWDYQVEASGEWKGPFTATSQGKLDFSHTHFFLVCETLEGSGLGKPVSLLKPFTVGASGSSFNLSPLELTLGEGSATLSAAYSEKQGHLQMKASSFPLDFLTLFSNRFSLSGHSNLEIDLQAKERALVGKIDLLLQRADIYQTGSQTPIQTKGSIQLNFAEEVLQLHTHLVATGEQLCDAQLSLPFHFTLAPCRLNFARDKPIAGKCMIEGFTEQLFDFINIGSQRVGGFVSTHLLLSGNLHAPLLYGPLSVQGGFYENYFIGIAVKDAAIEAEAVGKKVIVKHATTTDGEKGSSQATAVFHLEPGLPFSAEGTVRHFRLLRFNWLTGAGSGPFTINGNLERALARSRLELDEADVSIPDAFPSDITVLPVTLINQGKNKRETLTYSEPYPFHYELDVHAEHDCRLSGRGIEADLAGDVQMVGKNLSVVAAGALYTKKGKFSFAGKEFNITKGELRFSETSAFMNITSQVELANLTVTIHFRGSVSNPQLIFESSPPMPTSSILSHILFNKDVSELTTSEAVQLANTIVSLAGGSGPSVLDTIRKSLGIDRLSFSVSDEGKVSVQIGKYLTHGVTITLNQSTETSHVKVEVELKGGFMLEAETQEDDQGKFSFKWNKNY